MSVALSIVIPVYNGAESIGELVDALETLDVPGGHEIVLVNDCSPDSSLFECRRLQARAKVPIAVIDLARNFGEHNAVMAGLREARGAHIITMDDDLQNPPGEVLRLLLHAQKTGKDVIYTHYAKKQHTAWRNLGSRFANRVADVVLDKPRGLYLSSFRCLSAFVAKQVTRYEGPFPYIDGLIMQATQSIGTLEVAHLPRNAGRSNYTLTRLVRLWLSMALNFSVIPLRIATFAGFGLSGVGLIGVFWVIGEATFRRTPPGWASLTVATLMLLGMQLIMLGIIGEYLGRLYLTANRKPQSIVREVTRNESTAPEHRVQPAIISRG
jgi:undecaprenyl-phosphate 4-deoxy-4-formamido-L-arabinose transferase